jgi:hypothetical protein
MGDRVRAVAESSEEKTPAPVIVRPQPAPGNRAVAERIAAIDQEFADANVDEELLTSDYGLKDREAKARQVREEIPGGHDHRPGRQEGPAW